MTELGPKAKKLLESQVRIRPATEADTAFIFNSWLKCCKHGPTGKLIQSSVFYAGQHQVIEGLLKTTHCFIACNHNDVSQIFGYAVAERVEDVFVVHMVYVKEPYRRLGIASALLEALGLKEKEVFFFTHKTQQSDRINGKINMVYHPFLAYKAYEAGK